jgi:hypothetical protein
LLNLFRRTTAAHAAPLIGPKRRKFTATPGTQ